MTLPKWSPDSHTKSIHISNMKIHQFPVHYIHWHLVVQWDNQGHKVAPCITPMHQGISQAGLHNSHNSVPRVLHTSCKCHLQVNSRSQRHAAKVLLQCYVRHTKGTRGQATFLPPLTPTIYIPINCDHGLLYIPDYHSNMVILIFFLWQSGVYGNVTPELYKIFFMMRCSDYG